MHPDERALRNSYAAFNAGDLERAAEIMANDVEWPDQLEGITLHGKAEALEYLKRLATVQRHHYEVVHCHWNDQGDMVASLLRTVSSPGGEVISNGLIRHVYRFQCGKVVRMQILL